MGTRSGKTSAMTSGSFTNDHRPPSGECAQPIPVHTANASSQESEGAAARPPGTRARLVLQVGIATAVRHKLQESARLRTTSWTTTAATRSEPRQVPSAEALHGRFALDN